MAAKLSERIGELVIPATVQCTTPETTDDDLRTLTVYGAWTPDEQLEYAGTTTQALHVRARQHLCDAWRDETCCPLCKGPCARCQSGTVSSRPLHWYQTRFLVTNNWPDLAWRSKQTPGIRALMPGVSLRPRRHKWQP